ncbi:MAG: methyltransferase domain-containing protein [Candidatus Sumerlaeia bacterium]
MDPLDRQREYWDRVVDKKNFANPLDFERFARLVPKGGRVLDLGCGYGRICGELLEAGWQHVAGVDISPEMIRRGRELYPGADLRVLETDRVPFGDASFDAVLLFAVLTCVPGDAGQRSLIGEAERLLKPGGVIVVSDYPLQDNARNRARYAEFEKKYGAYGVFELPEGTVLRHHDMNYVEKLLSPFRRIEITTQAVLTMNGHEAKIFQYYGRKAG